MPRVEIKVICKHYIKGNCIASNPKSKKRCIYHSYAEFIKNYFPDVVRNNNCPNEQGGN